MLFGINTEHYTYMSWGSAGIKEVAVNNFYYYTDTFIELRGASAALAALAALLVFMTLLKTGTAYLASYFIIPMRNSIVRDIRNTMYDKLVTLPLAFYTSERKGDVMARISGDVTEIENSVMQSIDMLFKNPVMIIVCLGMMIAISWQLTLFVLVLLPLAGIVMGKTGRHLKRASLEAQQQWGIILSTVEETLTGLRVVKSFNAEKKMENRFHNETGLFYRISNAIQRRYALAHPMSEFLGTAAIAIVLWFGGSLILSGHAGIDAAGFIYYMVIFYSIINPAKEFSKAGYAIQKGMASLQRVDRILGAENPVADPDKPLPAPLRHGGGAEIEFCNVGFSYIPGREIIRDVNLCISAGSTVAIVGQSGSGKSTLADLVPRFHDTVCGTVRVDGNDVRRYRVAELRSIMGTVSQEAVLFNDTFFNNIAFGVENVTQEDVEQAARIANAHEFIMQSEHGYQTIVGDRGCRLSGGQRQRISIARAVLRNPRILILDEATSALDTESERLVQEALDRLMSGRTTIVIAHRLSSITEADMICVMQNGRIVESGTHASLLELDGMYRRLVEMQGINTKPHTNN